MKKVFTFIFCLFSMPAFSQEIKSIEQLQQEESINKGIDASNNLLNIINTMSRERQAECMEAIGYSPFCNCIDKELPIAFSFTGYISITTHTKEENGYNQLDEEMKLAYDKVPGIRDKCVKLINDIH
jgi:hypothetical protein